MSEAKNKLLSLLSGWEETLPEEGQAIVQEFLKTVSNELVTDFIEKYEQAGADWGFSEGSLLVRTCLQSVLEKLLNIEIKNEHNLKNALEILKDGKAVRIVIVSNHLSYSDANIIAVAFHQFFKDAGFENDLSVIAGPKVFSHPLRKFASMHFHSLLIAQSQSVATLAVPYPIRVIARAATKVAEDIKEKVKIFLVFPEGKRSRDGSLNQFILGVYRLIDTDENVLVLPVSVLGGDKLLPISHGELNFTDIKINIGEPEYIREITKKTPFTASVKQDIMDYIGKKVAALHPAERRGFYS